MEHNKELDLAWDFVENTGTSIFLTGKAGTGKTTFLKELRRRSPKRMIVVAPTGVAAINAGGVTIHSFFQLPLSPFIPDASYADEGEKRRFRFSSEKRNIIRTLDLLVIDEISMVRSDLLDAVDSVMRKYRNPYEPFGGVQLLMIGDLQQLAPVVVESEEALLRQYYDTPYFFGSHALSQLPYVTIELQQVFRQRDEAFVGLLNRIRENRIDQSVVDMLNSRYNPAFHPQPEEGYIRLTTHNMLAQRYNEGELAKLTTPASLFEAKVDGTFPEYAYPTEQNLTLKVGAQVMFVKNDSSSQHLFYNGRIGHVTAISGQAISVRCPGDDADINVQPLAWENTRYSLNEETREIEEIVDGTFTQYPLRLAWAITIHKSQGLTFERAIIDAGASFAHGQVYVALSRCKTLEGLVLVSPIQERSVFGDAEVSRFIAAEAEQARQSVARLAQLKQAYYAHLLCELFDFSNLIKKEGFLCRILDEFFYRTYPALLNRHKTALPLLKEKVELVSQKFIALVGSLDAEQMHGEAFLQRVIGGAEYFHQALEEVLGTLLEETTAETDNKEIQRRFKDALSETRQAYSAKFQLLALTAEHGFSTLSYLKDKEHAILQATEEAAHSRRSRGQGRKGSGNATAPRAEISADIKYPVLYERLRDWRYQKSESLRLPVYAILHQKALICMSNFLPCSSAELVAIPFFGKISTEKYGAELLEIINEYVEQNHIERPIPIVKADAPTSVPKKDTRELSFELYKAGHTPEQIANERLLTVNTVYKHLAHYVDKGDLSAADFVAPSKIQTILQVVERLGKKAELTALKELCGPGISYTDIRFVLASLHRSVDSKR